MLYHLDYSILKWNTLCGEYTAAVEVDLTRVVMRLTGFGLAVAITAALKKLGWGE